MWDGRVVGEGEPKGSTVRACWHGWKTHSRQAVRTSRGAARGDGRMRHGRVNESRSLVRAAGEHHAGLWEQKAHYLCILRARGLGATAAQKHVRVADRPASAAMRLQDNQQLACDFRCDGQSARPEQPRPCTTSTAGPKFLLTPGVDACSAHFSPPGLSSMMLMRAMRSQSSPYLARMSCCGGRWLGGGSGCERGKTGAAGTWGHARLVQVAPAPHSPPPEPPGSTSPCLWNIAHGNRARLELCAPSCCYPKPAHMRVADHAARKPEHPQVADSLSRPRCHPCEPPVAPCSGRTRTWPRPTWTVPRLATLTPLHASRPAPAGTSS